MYKIRQCCENWAQPRAFEAKYGSTRFTACQWGCPFEIDCVDLSLLSVSGSGWRTLKNLHRNVREGPGSCGPGGPAAVSACQTSGETSRGTLRGWVCSGKRVTSSGQDSGCSAFGVLLLLQTLCRGSFKRQPAAQSCSWPSSLLFLPPVGGQSALRNLRSAEMILQASSPDLCLQQACLPSDCTVHAHRLIMCPSMVTAAETFHYCFRVDNFIIELVLLCLISGFKVKLGLGRAKSGFPWLGCCPRDPTPYKL